MFPVLLLGIRLVGRHPGAQGRAATDANEVVKEVAVRAGDQQEGASSSFTAAARHQGGDGGSTSLSCLKRHDRDTGWTKRTYGLCGGDTGSSLTRWRRRHRLDEAPVQTVRQGHRLLLNVAAQRGRRLVVDTTVAWRRGRCRTTIEERLLEQQIEMPHVLLVHTRDLNEEGLLLLLLVIVRNHHLLLERGC